MKTTAHRILAAVLIGIGMDVAILLILMFTCGRPGHHPRRMIPEAHTARGIYTLLYAAEIDAEAAGATYWNSNAMAAGTSTEFFKSLASNVFQGVGPEFLRVPGLPAAKDWSSFTPEINAWCLNRSISISNVTQQRVPLIFTRNLHFAVENGKLRAFLGSETPFAKRKVILVTAGGAAIAIPPGDMELLQEFKPEDVADILRP